MIEDQNCILETIDPLDGWGNRFQGSDFRFEIHLAGLGNELFANQGSDSEFRFETHFVVENDLKFGDRGLDSDKDEVVWKQLFEMLLSFFP